MTTIIVPTWFVIYASICLGLTAIADIAIIVVRWQTKRICKQYAALAKIEGL